MVKNRFELTEIREDICPNCGGKDFDFGKNGEITCTTCALVVGVHSLDLTKEEDRFNYEDSGKLSRLGPADTPLYPGSLTKFYVSSNVKSDDRKKFSRLSKVHAHYITPDHLIENRMKIIRHVASVLNIPDYVLVDIPSYLKDAEEKNLLRMRSSENSSAAILYLACRKNKFPVSLDAIEKTTGASKKLTRKIYRNICWKLGIMQENPDYFAFMNKLADEVGLTPPERRLAEYALGVVHKSGMVFGRNPKTVAAATVFLSGSIYHPIFQLGLAKKANITEVSLRTRCRDMKEIFERFGVYHLLLSRFEPSDSYERIVADYFENNPDILMTMMEDSSPSRMNDISYKIFEYGKTKFGRKEQIESEERMKTVVNRFHEYLGNKRK
jgi:transcription initiation factor TFIIB